MKTLMTDGHVGRVAAMCSSRRRLRPVSREQFFKGKPVRKTFIPAANSESGIGS
jgi:hypothetical protein